MWVVEKYATIDFETRSEAGFVWDDERQTWTGLPGSGQARGIKAVGSAAYAEHPTTDILTMSYRLPDWPAGTVARWRPCLPRRMQDLFDFIAAGGLVEAHNAMFERLIWHHVATPRYGFPPMPAAQWRCSMAKARVQSLPGKLGELGEVLRLDVQKDKDGTRLLNKFSRPQKPTKADPRLWIQPEDDWTDFKRLAEYCDRDVLTEEKASSRMMPMSRDELAFWQVDQEMNWRGIGVDIAGVADMIAILEAAQERYGGEFAALTGGLKPSQVQATVGWLAAKGVHLEALDAEALDEALARTDLAPDARRVLEIRALVGSASVKKLYALQRATSRDGRIRNIIIHHGARTGRPTGDLVQPLNLPKAGPELMWCASCSSPSRPGPVCAWCGQVRPPTTKRYAWPDVPRELDGCMPIDWVMPVMATRSLDEVERVFGDALLTISGCVRGQFVAADGHDLIASDYSAIEAVVTAALAGCAWRLEAFRDFKDIYLVSCAQMGLGMTYEGYLAYKAENGAHHWHRQKKGKVAELALGFGGWIGAWKQFDPEGDEDEIKRTILDWRAASPEIVELWGGQVRGDWGSKRLERFGLEGAFVNAVEFPGQAFTSHGISFYMRGDALIVRLLSGRELTYHSPRLWPSTRPYALPGQVEITYQTWNTNPKYGPRGWHPMKTYSGKITENVVQATAHDIQRHGIKALIAAGYPVELHVYDENVAEVPKGFGSIEEFERIMSTMPAWAADWPIRASGGWRGRRYRKA